MKIKKIKKICKNYYNINSQQKNSKIKQNKLLIKKSKIINNYRQN